MTEPIKLEDREAFEAFCKEHLSTPADREHLLAMVKASRHPLAKQRYDQLCEAFYEQFGYWPKTSKPN